MKKEVKQIINGICRVTTLDSRFYSREGRDSVTGLPTIEWRRSITHIAHFYPKGKQYEEYLKKIGDDADEILDKAGERGSKVHQAIETLNNGGTVKMEDKFISNRTGDLEELTPDEYGCVMDYKRWWDEEGSKEYGIIGVEQTIWPEGATHDGKPLKFAATLDMLVQRKSDGKIGVLDIKTSKAIYDAHIIQVSAIAEAVQADFQAIIQVGYKPNKCRYKFTEIERRMDLYWLAWGICEREAEKAKDEPMQRDYPLSLSLGLPKREELPDVNSMPEVGAEPLDFTEDPKAEPLPEWLENAGKDTEHKQSRTRKVVKP